MNQTTMRKLVVSEWITLDGVFDADTMDQWFDPYESKEREAHIRGEILASGALLLGRTTYELLASYWPYQKNDDNGPASKLNSVAKYVVSSTLKKAEWNNSTRIKENVVEAIARLKEQPGQEILIEGSATLVQSLMETDLIDEYRFLVHPLIMGHGKRFFKDRMGMTKLKLIVLLSISFGVVVLTYQPDRT